MQGERGHIGLVGGSPQAGKADAEAVRPGSLVMVTVEDGDPEFAKAIEEQLLVVTGWWQAEAGFVQTALRSPAERHDVERFLYTSGIRDAAEDEPLVVYITSHGAVSPSGRHFLRLPDTDDSRLQATGMPTNELVIAALDSQARHVLVIVNACESGGIDVELTAFVRDLSRTRTSSGTMTVVATTATRSPVLGREFATILQMAFAWLRDAAGITRSHLSAGEFMSALEEATDRLNAERDLQLPGPRLVYHSKLRAVALTLPNPGYRPKPQVVAPARAEVAATHEELEYWLDRASGRANSDDPGWYFSGRQDLNRQLAHFASHDPGVLIVTGSAASGKSALLARTVTLSDPDFRASPCFAQAVRMAPADSVPAEGSVHVAVSARNRGPVSLIEAIGSRLGCAPDRSRPAADPLRQWQEGLRNFFTAEWGKTVTVVIDGVDESLDPAACIRDVLEPLAPYTRGPQDSVRVSVPAQQAAGPALPGRQAGQRGLRLLLAVRSSRPGTQLASAAPSLPGLLEDLRTAFPGAREARTDADGVETDISAYIAALLAAAPWARDAAEVGRAAQAVAPHVRRSFLDARLAAEQLRRSDGLALLRDPQWFAQLDRGTVGLFAEDLEHVADSGVSVQEAVALLRVTAFGLGRGIPWAQIWPAAAEGLLQARIDHADEKIRRLLESQLAGYLTHDTEDDRVVYRPAHEQLAAILRQWPHPRSLQGTPGGSGMAADDQVRDPGADEQEAHARITAELARLVAAHAARVPHPYLSRYLAHHAALGRTLDDEHVSPAVLPWLAGDGIRGFLALPHAGDAERPWLTAWASVEPYVKAADVASRCASLHLAYTAQRHPGTPHAQLPPEARSFAGSPLRVLWSQWSPPSNVLATLSRTCLSLTAVDGPGGGVLLALGNESGSIELVDAGSGTAVGDRIPAHEGAVRSLRFVPHPAGGGALLSGSTDGTVRMWDTNRGVLVNHMKGQGHVWTSDIAGFRDEAQVLTSIAINGEGAVTLWRDQVGAQQFAEMNAHPLEPAAFALTLTDHPDGRRLLVGAGGTLHVWDIASHELLHEYPIGSPVRSLTNTTVPGLIACGHSDGSIMLVDVSAGPKAALSGTGEPVIALAAVHVDGANLLAAAGTGPTIDIWDIDAQQWSGRLTGHTDTVTALCTLPPARRAGILASTARDNTVRVWDTEAFRRALSAAETAPAVVTAALTARSHTFPAVAVSRADAKVQLWDTGSGTTLSTLCAAQEPAVPALAWTSSGAGGQPLLLWAAADHSILTWDPLSTGHARKAVPLAGHSRPVRSLAAAVTHTRHRIVISGGDDSRVCLWDLDNGLRVHHWRHQFRITSVAAASDDSSTWYASSSFDGTVKVWDGQYGAPEHVLSCRQGPIKAIAVNARPSRLPAFLASGGNDGSVRLWDLTTYEPLGEPLQGHADAVEALATWTTVADEPRNWVASASRDGTIRFWDAHTSRCVLQLATCSPVYTLSAQHCDQSGGIVLTMAGEAGVAVFSLDLENL